MKKYFIQEFRHNIPGLNHASLLLPAPGLPISIHFGAANETKGLSYYLW